MLVMQVFSLQLGEERGKNKGRELEEREEKGQQAIRLKWGKGGQV